MNVWDILIIASVAISVLFAIRRILMKKGGCSCSDGRGCCGKCSKY